LLEIGSTAGRRKSAAIRTTPAIAKTDEIVERETGSLALGPWPILIGERNICW